MPTTVYAEIPCAIPVVGEGSLPSPQMDSPVMAAFSSTYEEKARRTGTLRPFLILSSMDAEMRLEVANELGVKLKRGDEINPHKMSASESQREAMLILDAKWKGLMSRSNGAVHSIFEGREKNTTWMHICRKAVKKDDSFFGKDSAPVRYDGLRAVRESNNAGAQMLCLEKKLLNQLDETIQNRLSEEEKEAVDRLSSGAVGDRLRQNFRRANVEIKHAQILVKLWVWVKIGEGGVRAQDFKESDLARDLLLGDSDKEKNARKKAVGKRVGKKVATRVAIVGVGLLLPVLGAILAIGSLVNMVGGSSEYKCVRPIHIILIQSLILASQGIRIS